MELYKKYLKDKSAYEYAKSYAELLNARDQAGGNFKYSACHSKLQLMICGQHRAGDKNYHESEAPLNAAILKSVNIRELIGLGVEQLRIEMVESLKNCQSEVDAVKAELERVTA